MGLAVMLEIPLIIINIQRGGPSVQAYQPKTEQSDLMQAYYGSNGECPMPIVSASTPSDCFSAVYEAVRICCAAHDTGYVFKRWIYCQRCRALEISCSCRFARN